MFGNDPRADWRDLHSGVATASCYQDPGGSDESEQDDANIGRVDPIRPRMEVTVVLRAGVVRPYLRGARMLRPQDTMSP